MRVDGQYSGELLRGEIDRARSDAHDPRTVTVTADLAAGYLQLLGDYARETLGPTYGSAVRAMRDSP